MKTNWVEDLWVNSPLRALDQAREVTFFRRRRPVAPGARVLEIGCGRGRGALLVQRSFAPQRIDAIDINPAMIRLATRMRRLRKMRGVHFTVADAQSLPFASASMDAVFEFGIIHHLEDWQEGLREVSRVLKDGGAFYFEEILPDLYANAVLRHLVPHPRQNRFKAEEFLQQIGVCGLRLLRGVRGRRYRILGVAVKEGVG